MLRQIFPFGSGCSESFDLPQLHSIEFCAFRIAVYLDNMFNLAFEGFLGHGASKSLAMVPYPSQSVGDSAPRNSPELRNICDSDLDSGLIQVAL